MAWVAVNALSTLHPKNAAPALRHLAASLLPVMTLEMLSFKLSVKPRTKPPLVLATPVATATIK
jgi:hypothetical protein